MNCVKITKQFEMKSDRGFLKKNPLFFNISISLNSIYIFLNLLMFVHAQEPNNNQGRGMGNEKSFDPSCCNKNLRSSYATLNYGSLSSVK